MGWSSSTACSSASTRCCRRWTSKSTIPASNARSSRRPSTQACCAPESARAPVVLLHVERERVLDGAAQLDALLGRPEELAREKHELIADLERRLHALRG